MQHCNLPGAVVLVLEKLRGQFKKRRKINFRVLLPGNCPVGRTMTGHSPWMTGLNHRNLNVRIVVCKLTKECAFCSSTYLCLNNTPSVFNAHSYIPDVM